MNIFEVIDKSGRKIRLTKKQWSHITMSHKEMDNYLEEIKRNLENPIKIIFQKKDVAKYFTYIKYRKHPEKYLRVIVKYLNGEGFIITAHFVNYIK
jgi:hypothetical protein